MELKWIVASSDAGYTISELLVKRKLSTRQRRKIRKKGQFFVNGKPVPKHYRPTEDDEVLIRYESTKKPLPWAYPLDIRYCDEYFLVVNKPSGMLAHQTSSERKYTLLNAIQAFLDERQPGNTPHPVHRLDRRTSGLILIATQPLAQYDFDRLSANTLQRRYTALLCGKFLAQKGSIHFPIARKAGSIIEREVNFTNGQAASTEITSIYVSEKYSRVSVLLRTGRTHQIRVHFAHLGFPLLGDDLYGGSVDRINRQALHADTLIFRHPYTNKVIRVTAPLPNDMLHIINEERNPVHI